MCPSSGETTMFMRHLVDCVWNVMAHAQKPDFVFRRHGRVHLNRRGRQFIRLPAAEMCASAVVMLDTPCSEAVWRVLATHSIRQFSLHFPSRASPCAITFQLDSTRYSVWMTVWYARPPATRQSSTQNNKYQVSHKHSCISWWWAHNRPKHVEIDKYTKNKLCTELFLFTRRIKLLSIFYWVNGIKTPTDPAMGQEFLADCLFEISGKDKLMNLYIIIIALLSALCRVATHIFPRQTMSLGDTLLQLFYLCCLWSLYV